MGSAFARLALVFGTAGLPHILVRFYTVPDAKTARVSVVWAMVIIGLFYIMTTSSALAPRTFSQPARIVVDGVANDTWPRRCWPRGSAATCSFAFISAVAFATILAFVRGLTIFGEYLLRARLVYTNVIHHGREHASARKSSSRDHRVRRRRDGDFLGIKLRASTSPSSSASPFCRGRERESP